MTRTCLLTLTSLLLGTHAFAQGVDTGGTPLGASRAQGTVGLPSARLLPSGAWELTLGYAHEGSVVRAQEPALDVRGGASGRERRWIGERDVGFVGLSVGLADRFELTATLPALIGQSVSDAGGVVAPVGESAALGDVHFAARWSLLGPRPTGRLLWTVQGGLSAPTGMPEAAFGEEEARFDAATTATGLSDGPWRISGHLGYQTGKALGVADQLFGDRVLMGASFAWRFLDFQASLDALSRVNTGRKLGTVEPERASLELLAGMRYLSEHFFVDLGAGGAPVDGGLAPRWRLLLAVGARGTPTKATVEAESDGDGVVEGDQCPRTAEDFDGFQDEDGCPDWDNDGDGVLDARDQCPNAAEDADAIADHDGCPETDADGDGIADETDRCPLAAEDYDGFEDEDGCPEPGARNEPAGSSVLDQLVFFETGSTTLDAVALSTIRSVAHVLLTKPGTVVITGHADDRGTEELNAQLSLARAEAVKAVLVETGIAADRLETRGVGHTQPLATPGGLGRALNRSVGFGFR